MLGKSSEAQNTCSSSSLVLLEMLAGSGLRGEEEVADLESGWSSRECRSKVRGGWK